MYSSVVNNDNMRSASLVKDAEDLAHETQKSVSCSLINQSTTTCVCYKGVGCEKIKMPSLTSQRGVVEKFGFIYEKWEIVDC